MARAFTTADIVQHAAGTSGTAAVPVGDPGIALPNPVVGGNGGIIVIGAQTVLSPAEQWDMSSAVGGVDTSSPQLGIFSRASLPDGDQSWAFSALGFNTVWSWVVEEWTNLSYVPVLTTAFTAGSNAPASKSSGTTGSWTAQWAVGIAAVYLFNSATGGGAWPSVSWSNGFVETDVITFGAGSTPADAQLRVARFYGTENETGPWETTATFSVAPTARTVYGCIAVFRAADLIEVPAPSVMSS